MKTIILKQQRKFTLIHFSDISHIFYGNNKTEIITKNKKIFKVDIIPEIIFEELKTNDFIIIDLNETHSNKQRKNINEKILNKANETNKAFEQVIYHLGYNSIDEFLLNNFNTVSQDTLNFIKKYFSIHGILPKKEELEILGYDTQNYKNLDKLNVSKSPKENLGTNKSFATYMDSYLDEYSKFKKQNGFDTY